MAVIGGKSLANGVEISTTLGTIALIPSTIDRFQVGQASLINSGSAIRTVSIEVLQSGDSVADNFKILVDKRLGVGETYLLFELIGISINSGGSIQAVVDTGTDVAIFINGTEFTV